MNETKCLDLSLACGKYQLLLRSKYQLITRNISKLHASQEDKQMNKQNVLKISPIHEYSVTLVDDT